MHVCVYMVRVFSKCEGLLVLRRRGPWRDRLKEGLLYSTGALSFSLLNCRVRRTGRYRSPVGEHDVSAVYFWSSITSKPPLDDNLRSRRQGFPVSTCSDKGPWSTRFDGPILDAAVLFSDVYVNPSMWIGHLDLGDASIEGDGLTVVKFRGKGVV